MIDKGVEAKVVFFNGFGWEALLERALRNFSALLYISQIEQTGMQAQNHFETMRKLAT
jgi:hypothetical protein